LHWSQAGTAGLRQHRQYYPVKLERLNGGHGGGHGTNRLVHEAIAAARTARAIIPSIFSTQSIPHIFPLDESSRIRKNRLRSYMINFDQVQVCSWVLAASSSQA
jgi:hypothetical protein